MPIAPSGDEVSQERKDFMSSAVKRAPHARRGHSAPINGGAPASSVHSNGATESQPSANAPIQWNYVIACEARNALQVLFSGGEILLDEEFGRLSPEQRTVVTRMIENARHLQNLLATLRPREEASSSDPLALLRQLKQFGY